MRNVLTDNLIDDFIYRRRQNVAFAGSRSAAENKDDVVCGIEGVLQCIGNRLNVICGVELVNKV